MPHQAPKGFRALKDKSPALQRTIRLLSQSSFEAIARTSIETISDSLEADAFLYGSHLSMIQIAAKDFRITFKAHFNLVGNPTFSRKKTGEKAILDLFMEYCNLVAGGLSQELHQNGHVSGMSLPFATTGFVELIASDEVKPSCYADYWTLAGAGFRFTCTAVLDLLNDTCLDGFKSLADNTQARGDIEFL